MASSIAAFPFRTPTVFILALVLWAGSIGGTHSQTLFINLDFESATNVPMPDPRSIVSMPAMDAFPGWTAYIGTNAVSTVTYDALTLGSANISLGDINGLQVGVIAGRFSALLQAGVLFNPTAMYGPVSLAQTGQIPATARSVRFEALTGPGAPFVTFKGQNLPLLQLGTNDYAADITAFEGVTGELRFGAQPIFDPGNPNPPHLGDSFFLLDNIFFSIEPVPEPGTGTAILWGAALVIFFRKRNPLLRVGSRR